MGNIFPGVLMLCLVRPTSGAAAPAVSPVSVDKRLTHHSLRLGQERGQITRPGSGRASLNLRETPGLGKGRWVLHGGLGLCSPGRRQLYSSSPCLDSRACF